MDAITMPRLLPTASFCITGDAQAAKTEDTLPFMQTLQQLCKLQKDTPRQPAITEDAKTAQPEETSAETSPTDAVNQNAFSSWPTVWTELVQKPEEAGASLVQQTQQTDGKSAAPPLPKEVSMQPNEKTPQIQPVLQQIQTPATDATLADQCFFADVTPALQEQSITQEETHSIVEHVPPSPKAQEAVEIMKRTPQPTDMMKDAQSTGEQPYLPADLQSILQNTVKQTLQQAEITMSVFSFEGTSSKDKKEPVTAQKSEALHQTLPLVNTAEEALVQAMRDTAALPVRMQTMATVPQGESMQEQTVESGSYQRTACIMDNGFASAIQSMQSPNTTEQEKTVGQTTFAKAQDIFLTENAKNVVSVSTTTVKETVSQDTSSDAMLQATTIEGNQATYVFSGLENEVTEGIKQADAGTQILKRLEQAIQKSESSFVMQLQPEKLGRITVTLRIEEGKMNIVLHTVDEKTQVLLQEHLSELRSSIGLLPVKVSDIQVEMRQTALPMQNEFFGQHSDKNASTGDQKREAFAFHTSEQEKSDTPWLSKKASRESLLNYLA